MPSEDSFVGMILEPLKKWAKTKNAPFAVVGTIALLIALAWLFSKQASAFPAADPFNFKPPTPSPGGPAGALSETLSVSGYAQEGGTVDESFDLEGDRIWEMVVEFTFRDEADDMRRRFTNNPDEFEITITFPDDESDTLRKSGGNDMETVITKAYNWTSVGGMDWSDEETGSTNNVVVTVSCTNAGDQEPLFAPFGFRVVADNGNDYSLSVEYTYTPEKTK
jgi:hypothetical protein